jgi:D-glycero-D-manno-heptose 1,7-bisphosphate phosphatase
MGIGRGLQAVSSAASRRAIFLDRDGVLIEAIIRSGRPFSAMTPRDVHIIPGVSEACRELSGLDFLLVMITNQPEVARGKITREFVERTNETLAEALGLDDVEACLHDSDDNCDCRKPKPGLILRAAAKLGIDLRASVVVGDRWSDIVAGRSAGCRTVFIDYGYDEAMSAPPDHAAASLLGALPWIRAHV